MGSSQNWPRVKFGDVVNLNKDRIADPAVEGIERYVGIKNIEPEDLRVRSWGLVEEGTTFTNYFQPGQVLFVKRRAYQRKVAVADFAGVCSGDIYVLESKNPTVLLPDLLPFICQTDGFFNHAVGTSAGSLSPRTNWTQLANYEFTLPPLAEQRRIAEMLSICLQVVEMQTEAIQMAETCLESVREHYFSEGQSQPRTLGKVLKVIQAGKSVVGFNEPPSFGEYAVLKVSAAGAKSFRPEESKTLVDQNDFIADFSLQSGDLIVTRANTPEFVGMACYVEQNYPNLMLSDKTLRLIPKKDVSPELLREALWTRHIRQQIKSMATGTGAAMKNISQAKLRKLVIRLPSDTSGNSHVLRTLSEIRVAIGKLQLRQQQTVSAHKTCMNELLS